MTHPDSYELLTNRIMLKGSAIIPKLFAMIASREEAELLLAMPGTKEQLAGKTGRPAKEIERICSELYRKGVAFKSRKGGAEGFRMCRDMIQFHDGTILWPEAPRAYYDLWQKFMEEEWPAFARGYEKVLPRAVTRVIPVEKSIDTGKQLILDGESASAIVNQAKVLAVTPCTCRLIAGKCDSPSEVCLQVDNAARYTLDRGTGRAVTREQALEILRECEEKGLVHVTMNKLHVGHFICNCCSCCCQAMPLIISEGLKICDPSRYRALIDKALCSSCGLCSERCYFNAVQEGNSMEVNPEKCMGCGLCHVACPEEAISLVAVRPADFIPE